MEIYVTFLLFLCVNSKTSKIIEGYPTPFSSSKGSKVEGSYRNIPQYNENSKQGSKESKQQLLYLPPVPVEFKNHLNKVPYIHPTKLLRSHIKSSKNSRFNENLNPRSIVGHRRNFRKTHFPENNLQQNEFHLKTFTEGEISPLEILNGLYTQPEELLISSNSSVLSQQKSYNWFIPKALLLNMGQLSTEASTSLRPWQVNCCPQNLKDIYNEGKASSVKPWQCFTEACLPQFTDVVTTVSEFTSNAIYSNNSTNATVSSITNTSYNATGTPNAVSGATITEANSLNGNTNSTIKATDTSTISNQYNTSSANNTVHLSNIVANPGFSSPPSTNNAISNKIGSGNATATSKTSIPSTNRAASISTISTTSLMKSNSLMASPSSPLAASFALGLIAPQKSATIATMSNPSATISLNSAATKTSDQLNQNNPSLSIAKPTDQTNNNINQNNSNFGSAKPNDQTKYLGLYFNLENTTGVNVVLQCPTVSKKSFFQLSRHTKNNQSLAYNLGKSHNHQAFSSVSEQRSFTPASDFKNDESQLMTNNFHSRSISISNSNDRSWNDLSINNDLKFKRENKPDRESWKKKKSFQLYGPSKKKRSVHTDFFSIMKGKKKCQNDNKGNNKTECKAKFQTSPFYNLTSLLGVRKRPIWSQKKLLVCCSDEKTTQKASSAKKTKATIQATAATTAKPTTNATLPTTESTSMSTIKLLLALFDRPTGTNSQFLGVSASLLNNSLGESNRKASTVKLRAELNETVKEYPATCLPPATQQSCTNEKTILPIYSTTCPVNTESSLPPTKLFSRAKNSNPGHIPDESYAKKLGYSETLSDNLLISTPKLSLETYPSTTNALEEGENEEDSEHHESQEKDNSFSYIKKRNMGKCQKTALTIGRVRKYKEDNYSKTREKRHRPKRNITSQNGMLKLINNDDFSYLLIPWNSLKDNYNIVLLNSEGQKEKVIHPRSILGQLLPCCIGKGMRPKEQEKKPWEQPWTPKHEKFPLYKDSPSNSMDFNDLQFLRSLRPNELTTPPIQKSLIDFDGGQGVCPTCGNRKNKQPRKQEGIRYMSDGKNDFDNIWNDNLSHSTTHTPSIERSNVLSDPNCMSGSNEIGCGNCWTYVLNYPKEGTESVYFSNRKATTMKTVRFIETFNNSPKYYMEIPEALGDLIKKTAVKSCEAEPANCTDDPLILFQKKAKSLKESERINYVQNHTNTKDEPVFLVLRPFEISNNKPYLSLTDLYKLFNNINLQTSTSLPVAKIADDEDFLRDSTAHLRHVPESKHMRSSGGALPSTSLPLALIPMFVPESNPTIQGNNNYPFNSNRLVHLQAEFDDGNNRNSLAKNVVSDIKYFHNNWIQGSNKSNSLNVSNIEQDLDSKTFNDSRLNNKDSFIKRYSTAWPYFKPPYLAIMNESPENIPFIEFRKTRENQKIKRTEGNNSDLLFTSNIGQKFKKKDKTE